MQLHKPARPTRCVLTAQPPRAVVVVALGGNSRSAIRARAPRQPEQEELRVADLRERGSSAAAYRIPNIPGMDGMPMRPPPAIFFIIFCISRNWSRRRFTSLIGRPAPFA